MPCALQRLAVGEFVQQAVVDAPCEAEGVECRAAGLVAGGIVLVEQRAAPVAVALGVRALALAQALCHAPIVADIIVAVRVVSRQLVQHTGEGSEDPSVAARPEVLAAGSGGVLREDVAAVAVIQAFFLVPHQVGAPAPVFVHLLEVEWVAGDEVEL